MQEDTNRSTSTVLPRGGAKGSAVPLITQKTRNVPAAAVMLALRLEAVPTPAGQ